jgi:hypothetical protein
MRSLIRRLLAPWREVPRLRRDLDALRWRCLHGLADVRAKGGFHDTQPMQSNHESERTNG